VGTVGDIFGPPGEGKSSLTLDFAIAVASGTGNWYGLPCVSGPVALLGGERSGTAAFSRDLYRARQSRNIDPGMLVLPQNSQGDCPPLWAWDKKTDQWMTTGWGAEVTAWLASVGPVLIIIDTLASAASGSDIINQPQQYSLGVTVRQWARMLGDPTVLTVSHTNQASAVQEVARRLHYLSRAGGNGLPGALRWIAGVTLLRGGERARVPEGLDFDPDDPTKRYIAFGVSKNNEMPCPTWTPERPAIFQMNPGGGLSMVPYQDCKPYETYANDGSDKASQSRPKKKQATVNPIAATGASRRDNEYWKAKNGDDHVRW
jgi:hypothetical protein